ncbi:hypothetical protein DFO73_106102 [Cytobacillus oceanisediminis]|uniref:PH (Pleckstrin Homology) domain-containing protein n=1 Tax=Cytobacillus oceanisediminis TaxID=665099 RepID=A0A2V2ZV40_9BACI|nr:hypothetical protein [Cytobacillus oceanisediminis]PWW28286.1 hypothetical protein DFO73_106102 [Cytobacillus oceanisediminis]
MGREIHFGEVELTLKLTGLTAYFALKRKIIMPYSMIKNVTVDYFQAPQWMLRMPGTSIAPLNIYEGSYKYGNEWYFLSYERREPLMIIGLEGHVKYNYVIFQIDLATKLAAEVRRRINELNTLTSY